METCRWRPSDVTGTELLQPHGASVSLTSTHQAGGQPMLQAESIPDWQEPPGLLQQWWL